MSNPNPKRIAVKGDSMTALERILLVGVAISVAYRYTKEEWPVSVEVEE